MGKVSPPPLPLPPADPLDWERIVGPSCCVCGEVYLPPESQREHVSDGNGNRRQTPSSRRGDGARNGEESYVVLPDSTPVLSEDYFALARYQNFGVAVGSASSGGGVSFGGARVAGGSQVFGPGIGRNVGGSSLPPGSELLESGYSLYGGSGGFGGGWTGSGFGVGGSSMLESIVQISHAGLSDNVRRETLLFDLSQRPARRSSAGGAGEVGGETGSRALSHQPAGGGGSGDGGGEEEGEHDPTLCCHCYASLLEQIDEDSRLADREALAYRDFVELLDGISEDDGLEQDSSPNAPSRRSKLEGSGDEADEADGAAQGRDEPEGSRKAGRRNRSARSSSASRPAACSSGAGGAQTKQQQEQEDGEDKGAVVESSSSAPFAQALQIAEQTSEQLRTELRSLGAQRASLCARGSEAWAALSELSYARGVLGDECRELLQVSKEVAENAEYLSERSALSDLFSIRHIDGFPSINGYRLGRAPDDKRRLHWNEINAAWGEAALLVRCVSNAVDFHSRRFRLVPLNCASRVVELASGDDSGDLSQEGAADRRGHGSQPSTAAAAAVGAGAGTSVVVCAHDLFSSGSGGRGGGRGGSGGEEKLRYLAAVRAFLACSAEVISFVERRVLGRRLEGELSAGAACVAWSDVGVPYKQTEDSVGGVSIGALKSQASWKAWLCQLVKNLEWAVSAASSLCVA